MAIITYQSRHSGEHIDNQIDAVNDKLDKTGTAVAADKLSAKRNIQLIGSVQGSAEFDGSDNIKIDTVVMNDSHSHEKVTKADRLDISNVVGSETTPVYFVAGQPVALTYSLNATVPYDAKFTDTTYSEATQAEPGLMSPSDKSKLDHIADGATANIGDITSVIAGNGLTGGATSGDATLSLATSGVTAGTYGPSADVTGSNGSTISVPQITVDSFGRVTSVANRTFTNLKNPYAITIQGNGTTLTNGTYDGSAAKTVNITPAAIGALPSGGTAVAANKLATARTISLTGSVTGSGTFDGSGNLSIATTTNHTHSYLPLSGGTMTGNISYQGSEATYAMIKWIDNSNDTYGNGIEIGGGGAVVIGGGESSSAMRETLGSGGDEVLYLCNDRGIDFYTNVQSGASTAIHTYITNAGESHWVKCHGAVWNDYAEFRICNEEFKPGQVVCENGDDTLSIANQRLQRGCSIVSDTYGFAIGETNEAKCPIAVSGRVLAYTYEPREEFKAGEAVCAGPGGTVSRMTREEIKEYPERIIGTVSAVPNYETWGSGDTPVNGRIWIKVK